jgi:cytoskeleton protein RodZ
VPRFLEAIENDDLSELPGLLFTRNFVRQYALALKLDPDPLLAELPAQDESSISLPDPPELPRSSYHLDRTVHLILSSVAWLLVPGCIVIAYIYFNHSPQTSVAGVASQTGAPALTEPPPTTAPPTPPPAVVPTEAHPAAGIVQVTLTAREAAWVQLSADGKTTFTGTLQSNETKEVSAAEQVRILTGNAGALTISLNGKTLESIGPLGQVRVVNLTAEGPQRPPKDPRTAPDPL